MAFKWIDETEAIITGAITDQDQDQDQDETEAMPEKPGEEDGERQMMATEAAVQVVQVVQAVQAVHEDEVSHPKKGFEEAYEAALEALEDI